jgi:AraC-like DNA-binding protein
MILLSGILIVISVPPLLLSYFYSSDSRIDFTRINAYSMSSATAYTQTLVSVALLVFPQILYGIPRSRSAGSLVDSSGIPKPVEAVAEDPSETIKHVGGEVEEAGQNQEPFIELGERVLRFMEEEKPYVDSDFTLETLARSMGVPKHHLYYCFQNILKTKFTRLRTEHRIEHAKRLLAEADLAKTTLVILGKESGFASTSAFYTTFKAEVGCTPGEFAARVNPSYQG